MSECYNCGKETDELLSVTVSMDEWADDGQLTADDVPFEVKFEEARARSFPLCNECRADL